MYPLWFYVEREEDITYYIVGKTLFTPVNCVALDTHVKSGRCLEIKKNIEKSEAQQSPSSANVGKVNGRKRAQ